MAYVCRRALRGWPRWDHCTSSAAIRALAWALVACGALACESHHYLTYELRLVSATRQMVDPQDPGAEPELLWFARSAHKDEYIVTAWTTERDHLQLELSNKSQEPVRIDWGHATLTDEVGVEHAVSLMDAEGEATLIQPGERWVGRLYPSDYEYEPGKIQPLLPSAPGNRRSHWHGGEPQTLLKLAGRTVGKSLVVELPMSVGAARMIYRFEFDIRDFELRREAAGAT